MMFKQKKKINNINEFIKLLNYLVYNSFEKDYFTYLKKKEILWHKDIKKIQYMMQAIVQHFENILKIENIKIILDILKLEKKKMLEKKYQNIDFASYKEKKAMWYHMYCFLDVVYCVLITETERIETKNLDFDNLKEFFISAYGDEKWEYKRRYTKLFPQNTFIEKALTKRLRKKK